jgi:uncharacterized protein YrrD
MTQHYQHHNTYSGPDLGMVREEVFAETTGGHKYSVDNDE